MCVLGLVSQAKAPALSLVGMNSCLGCFGKEGCDMQSHDLLRAKEGVQGTGEGHGNTPFSTGGMLECSCCLLASPRQLISAQQILACK